ncbi:MAG: rhodanese-related sulfurtransferase [Chlamydiales bacterium]|nr:rhodanese-related sulfurtransferase [Chlamydiales bacterium]
MSYLVIAFYCFETIADPHAEVAIQKKFLQQLDVTSRIYISEQGMNGQMSASLDAAEKYMEWLKAREPFAKVDFKVQPYHEHVFPRLIVKYRKQLVALDRDVDMSKTAEHVSPVKWKEMLEDGTKRLVLDVRNDYECRVGHFEGAELPPCSEFRKFTKWLEGLKEEYDPATTPVMMYCTGGIRCEVFSSLMKEEGFATIYQLDGGVIKYAEKVGSAHWLGKLFVFDDRLTVPLAPNSTSVVGKCHHCGAANESYYNCASMDCNNLFLCCQECLHKFEGCCTENCQNGPRVRPLSHLTHKPYRKWYHYANKKEDLWKLRTTTKPADDAV